MENDSSRSLAPQTPPDTMADPPKEYAVGVSAVILGGNRTLSFTVGLGNNPSPPSPEWPLKALKADASIGTTEPLSEIGAETKPEVTVSETGFHISFSSPTFPVNTEVTVEIVFSALNADDQVVTFSNLTNNTFTTVVPWTE